MMQIAKIREDVDYYISSCCESDFEENEELYEELKLDEASAALGSRLAAMNHDNDDHSSDVSSEAPSLQNSAESVSPSPSLAHSKVAFGVIATFSGAMVEVSWCFCTVSERSVPFLERALQHFDTGWVTRRSSASETFASYPNGSLFGNPALIPSLNGSHKENLLCFGDNGSFLQGSDSKCFL